MSPVGYLKRGSSQNLTDDLAPFDELPDLPDLRFFTGAAFSVNSSSTGDFRLVLADILAVQSVGLYSREKNCKTVVRILNYRLLWLL